MAALALISGTAGLFLAFTTGVTSFFILLVMSLLGLAYNLKIIPAGICKKRIRRIKDIPGSKTILITMAWGIVTSILPSVDNNSPMTLSELNQLDQTQFIAYRDGVLEHSPWIAEQTWPFFASCKALQQADEHALTEEHA